ncbi:unnamed protein product [Alopecurus aequalis]
MPAAAAAAPAARSTGGTPPPDLGFPAPPRDPPPPTPPLLPGGTEVATLLKLSEEYHTPDLKGSEASPDSKTTPGSSEFFLRKPKNSERKTPMAHQAFTDEQCDQLAAQIVVHLNLKQEKPPTKADMILAFGETVEDQVRAWEEVWCAVAAKWESQNSPLSGLDTPPSSSLIGSCIAEQDSEDTSVAKTIISEPHINETHADSLRNDGVEEASGDLDDDGSARIEPVKFDPGCEAVSCFDKADPVLFDDGNDLKKNTTCSCQTLLESHCGSASVQHPEILSGSSNISSPIQGWTEQDWCVKCGKDGQLLNCYSCSLAAHRSCLGSLVRFSDSGDFCCPVCYNKAAAEEYEKSKKKYSEAKKNLYAFFGSKQFANQHGNHQPEAANPSREDGVLGHEKKYATGDACPEELVTEKTTTFGPYSENGKAHEVGNSISEAPCSESQNGFIPVVNHSPSHKKVRFQEKGTPSSTRKASGRQNQYIQSPARKRCYPYPPECCYTPARSPTAPRRRSFVSTVRRIRLLWTGEEEEALRELVARFAPKDKGNISWIQIREHGKDVFHPSRVPSDLRQKWNYMKKRDETRKGPSFAGLDPSSRRASGPPAWMMRDEARKEQWRSLAELLGGANGIKGQK